MTETTAPSTESAAQPTQPAQIVPYFPGMTREQLQAAKPPEAAPVTTGATVTPVRRDKVAILGFVGHFQQAPFQDDSWEIWGLNELYDHIPRWTRWFELHDRALYENDRNRTSAHVEKLKSFPTSVPIYMHRHWDDIPASVAYPINDIARIFPNPCPEARPYLTNSITYMILLAIAEGFKDISIFGVDMAHDCLAPEMRVLTSDLRWVPAGSLTIGQELLAFDEEVPEVGEGEPAQFRKYRRTRVESLSRIKRPCYRLTMADGSTLVASEGHQWLTLGGIKNVRRWMETKKAQPRSSYPKHATRIVKLTDVWDEDRSWEAGYLAAAFDGEGHLSQIKRTNCTSTGMVLGFAQRDNAMRSQVEQSLGRLGFDFRGADSEDGCTKYNIKGGRPELLRFLGQVRPRRLLDGFDPNGVGTLNSIDDVQIVESEAIGEQEVVGLQTGTRTLIVEGFASHNSEYGSQRPSCEWAIGIAQGAGRRIYLPSESDLLKTVYLYGYEAAPTQAFERKLRARHSEMVEQVNRINAEIERLKDARSQYVGAQQDVESWLKNWKAIPIQTKPTTS